MTSRPSSSERRRVSSPRFSRVLRTPLSVAFETPASCAMRRVSAEPQIQVIHMTTKAVHVRSDLARTVLSM